MTRNLRTLAVLLVFATPLVVTAQDGGVPSWIGGDPFSGGTDDPLGVDRDDRLERVAPTRLEEEVSAHIPVTQGEVLGAIGGVREEHHEVDVRLEHGLALVEVRMQFRSRARHAAEVRYRLAVPEGASLASLRACNRNGCREGAIDASAGVLGPYDLAVRARAEVAERPPIAHAAPVEDDRGHAIWLRAAPVMPRARELLGGRDDSELDLTVRYVVAAPVRGARVRLTLPERGRDPRAAPARVRIRSSELSHGEVDGQDAVEREVEAAAQSPIEITAQLLGAGPATATEAWIVPCGSGRCARLRAVATPRPSRARDLIVLIDASPSTASSARGRIEPAIAALLSSLPSRSRLRLAAFAARAEAIIETPTAPTEISLVEVTRALSHELGSATRFEAAWELVEPWVRDMHDPLILVVGDGGLTISPAATRAFEAARRAGVELAALNVADRPTGRALAGALDAISARRVDAGAEADRAARGHGMQPLAERLSVLLAPMVEPRVRARIGSRIVVLGALRAGEEVVFEGPVTGRGAMAFSPNRTPAGAPPDELLVAVRDRLERAAGRRDAPVRLAALAPESLAQDELACSIQGPQRSASAPVGPQVRVIEAATRRCDRSPFPTPSPADSTTEALTPAHLRTREGPTGLPERSLLTMLRQRIVPAARGCFRDDRRGRPSYQRRAVFAFRLADREVIEADVEGALAASLRECLTHSMDTLDIPPFDGTVSVRYPIYTAPELPPPTLSLDPDIADAVDGVSEEPL